MSETPAYKDLQEKYEQLHKDYEKFVAATLKMRQLQSKYFSSRTGDNLRAAKSQEAYVDKLVKNYGSGAVEERKVEQKQIF